MVNKYQPCDIKSTVFFGPWVLTIIIIADSTVFHFIDFLLIYCEFMTELVFAVYEKLFLVLSVCKK